MELNVSSEKLTSAGYDRISPRLLLLNDPVLTAVWRKEFRDDLGLRYRIDILEADLSPFTGRNVFRAEAHFVFTNGGRSTVTHSIDRQEIGDVEDYFEEIWCHMGFAHVEGGHDYGKAGEARG